MSIVTGPIRTGKTTRLARWAEARGNVTGVLSPDGPDGRIFVDLATGESIAMENPDPDEPVQAIGRFRFRSAAFDWANARLLAAANGPGTVIVDEVGPLELDGGGLRQGVAATLARPDGRTILVVRETLVDDVRRTLDIPHAGIEPLTG